MIHRFFTRLFGPSFEQGLVLRLLDQNQALVDRLLYREGVEPIAAQPETVIPPQPERAAVADDEQLAETAQYEHNKQLAAEAAIDEEALEQARFNADPENGHPAWQDWASIVGMAEGMMERAN